MGFITIQTTIIKTRIFSAHFSICIEELQIQDSLSEIGIGLDSCTLELGPMYFPGKGHGGGQKPLNKKLGGGFKYFVCSSLI